MYIYIYIYIYICTHTHIQLEMGLTNDEEMPKLPNFNLNMSQILSQEWMQHMQHDDDSDDQTLRKDVYMDINGNIVDPNVDLEKQKRKEKIRTFHGTGMPSIYVCIYIYIYIYIYGHKRQHCRPQCGA